MKQQFRSIQTRKKIEQSFFELLQKKQFHEITINQIIEIANIGRSTFYFHYEDKHDLLKQIATKYIQQFDVIIFKRFELIKKALKNRNEFLRNNYLSTSLIETINEVQKHKQQILILLTVQTEQFNMYNQYAHVLKHYSHELLVNHPIITPTATLPVDYVVDILSQTVLTSIIWLLTNGENETILSFINEFQYTVFKLISPYIAI